MNDQEILELLRSSTDSKHSHNDLSIALKIADRAISEGMKRQALRTQHRTLWLLSAAAIIIAIFTAYRERKERENTAISLLSLEGAWGF